MLTPGEFVVNKKAAQRVGYGALHKINKYASGGVVQHFDGGGPVPDFLQKAFEKAFEGLILIRLSRNFQFILKILLLGTVEVD
jgi:hypothetical protein